MEDTEALRREIDDLLFYWSSVSPKYPRNDKSIAAEEWLAVYRVENGNPLWTMGHAIYLAMKHPRKFKQWYVARRLGVK